MYSREYMSHHRHVDITLLVTDKGDIYDTVNNNAQIECCFSVNKRRLLSVIQMLCVCVYISFTPYSLAFCECVVYMYYPLLLWFIQNTKYIYVLCIICML